MNMEFTLGNMRNIVILEVKHPLSVLNDSTSITGNEELDRLRKAILGHERPRLSPEQFLTLSGRRRRKKVGVRDGNSGRTGVIDLARQFLGTLGFGVVEFDIDKIHLELLLRLNTDEKRGTSPSRNDLIMNRINFGSTSLNEMPLTSFGKWMLLKTNAKLP
jgi:hypothetical protein